MQVRLEKLALRSLETPVVVGEAASRRRFVPPSLKPEQQQPQPTEPPAPTYSEADLKAAEQEGYRRGFLEGTKEGQQQAHSEQAEVDQKLTAAINDITGQIQQMFDQYNAFARSQQADVPKLALAIARKIAGQALDLNPLPMVESMAVTCLERLLGEPHIIVTVHTALAATLEQRLGSHFKGNTDPGEINIQGSDTMAVSDFRIEWAFGKAERNTAQLWQQVEASIADMIATSGTREIVAPPGTDTPPPIMNSTEPTTN